MKIPTLIILDNSFHCSGVGSTPVGLWAHACNKTIELFGAAYKIIDYLKILIR